MKARDESAMIVLAASFGVVGVCERQFDAGTFVAVCFAIFANVLVAVRGPSFALLTAAWLMPLAGRIAADAQWRHCSKILYMLLITTALVSSAYVSAAACLLQNGKRTPNGKWSRHFMRVCGPFISALLSTCIRASF